VVFPYHFQIWAFVAFFVAFGIKVPMFPVHTWLPDAHVEAPTAGSVILAGVLLKMGAYGMLRFCLPMFPDASKAAIPYIVILSVVAIIYGALVSMMQRDLKKLVAYSSVSHMGFVTAGIFAAIAVSGNPQGMEGALLVMFSHGLLTGGLFLLVGFLYERTHTRQIAEMGMLAKPMPVLAAFFMVFALGSLGLPGLSGFVGEFLSLLGVFRYNRALGALAAVGVVLAACYLLWMYQRILFNDRGDAEVLPADEPVTDFGFVEVAAMVPLLVFVVWAGVYPDTFLNLLHVPVRDIIDHVGPSASRGSSTGFGFLLHLVGGAGR
jgi:NADH-quinone oxidoreductase subunit M